VLPFLLRGGLVLDLQLKLGMVSYFEMGAGILFAVPIVITWICFLVMKKWRILKWFGISTVLAYLIEYGFVSFFGGVPYHVAYRLGVFVPWTAQGLDQASDGAMDEVEEYYVLQMNEKQMNDFVKEVQAQGSWKRETTVPQSVLESAFVNSNMTNDQRLPWIANQKYTLPKKQTECLYYTKTAKRI
jgi:hypothetical protein